MNAPFSYDFPYPSQRMPVLAQNVVATSQPLAAQAGLQMMQQGGNAVDAAIASADSPNDLRLMIKLVTDAKDNPMDDVDHLAIEHEDDPATINFR